jgi:hypothetical protein
VATGGTPDKVFLDGNVPSEQGGRRERSTDSFSWSNILNMDPAVPFPSDPVIEEYKRHLDVTLLRESLKRTPEQRLLALMSMNELVTEMRRAVRLSQRPR